MLSRVQLFVTLWTVSPQVLSMGFSRQEYCSGFPFPSPGDLPDPGIEPGPPALEADSLSLSHQIISSLPTLHLVQTPQSLEVTFLFTSVSLCLAWSLVQSRYLIYMYGMNGKNLLLGCGSNFNPSHLGQGFILSALPCQRVE